MASVNKAIIIGNLGADPETRYAPSGDAICNIKVATTETWKDKASGEKREATEWHRVVFFSKLAEIANEYLRKGGQVYVEGRITTRKWQDKDGNDRYTTEIRGDTMKMLGSRGEGAGGGQTSRPAQQAQQRPQQQSQPAGGAQGGFGDFDDDIPFAPIARGIHSYSV